MVSTVHGAELLFDIRFWGVVLWSFLQVRCWRVQASGVTMDSTFLMFAAVMLVIFIVGIIIYNKSV